MQAGSFSRTAISTAAMRAVHQTLDAASIFADPLAALALIEEDGEAIAHASDPAMRPLRLHVALRSRIAEDVGLAALMQGARQVVVLGAGLDTFGHRVAPRAGLQVFEVDHPATQDEKRRRFARNGLAAPAHLAYAPCDFEGQTLADALTSAGFNAQARTAFLWLGVVPYLTPEAVEATLRFIAALPGGADVVFDYSNPAPAVALDESDRFRARMSARVAAIGEPFRCHFETPDLHERLRDLGFAGFDDFGPARIAERLGGPPRAHDRGGHILHAWRR
jgi:methyltransferase (TIGR00027 family)